MGGAKLSNEELLSRIKDIVACLTTCQTIEEFLDSIHSILNSIMYAENFYVVLKGVDERISFPYFCDTQDSFTEDELSQLEFKDLKATLTYFALESNEPCNFNFSDIAQLQRSGKVSMLGTTPKQWLCYPLVSKGESLGAFVIQSYRSTIEYCDYILDILLTLSHVIASALDAFNKQSQIILANRELRTHRDELSSLVRERTSELNAEKQKLELEVGYRKQTQVDLENSLKALQGEMRQKEQLQAKLEFDVTHDSLTGLANRTALFHAIQRITARNKRSNKKLFLLYLDLDGFKAVNDSFGHEAGDRVLIDIGQRISANIREYDLVARMGGDEFVILAEGVAGEDNIQQIAQRIIEDIEMPIEVGEDTISVSVSIGIACSDDPCDIETKLLRYADSAMYHAKKQGAGSIIWFHDIT